MSDECTQPLPTCEERISRLHKALFGNGRPELSIASRVYAMERKIARIEWVAWGTLGAVALVALDAASDLIGV
jgi:hypothetical protein